MTTKNNFMMPNSDKLVELSKLIGNTPLIAISYKYKGVERKAMAKAEWFNLSGSIKDRVALGIYTDAYQSGALKVGQTICETTSGNMGISLACLGACLGHKVVICMPKFMSEERKTLLKMYGADLVLTDDFEQSFAKAKEYEAQGAYLTLQFENPSNCIWQGKTTAQELMRQLHEFPAFVAGVGTGGTLSGTGEPLKQKYGTKIIAVEPLESKILSTGKSQGKHKIQGLCDAIIPDNYHSNSIDKIISVASDDAIAMSQQIAKQLGLGVGISSGANLLGCILSEIDGAITVFADDNKKYLSTELSTPLHSDLVDQIELLGYYVIR